MSALPRVRSVDVILRAMRTAVALVVRPPCRGQVHSRQASPCGRRVKFCYDRLDGCTGAAGSDHMQTPFAHPAVWRGLLLFAGMLTGKFIKPARPEAPLSQVGDLVSWRSDARSRREDELERRRQLE